MNGHSSIDPNEATEHLKNILNVGKSDTVQAKTKAVVDMKSSKVAKLGNDSTFQRVELTGDEENVTIYGTDVTVYSSPVLPNINSSNIMLDNIVDYGWERKYYHGRLVSIHLSKKYLAYALKSVAPTQNGFVRVIKHGTNTHLLLRGFTGSVLDLSFAHSLSRVLLGCVDEIGELFVYEIFDDNQTLKNHLCLHVIRPETTLPSIYHLLTWCPYIPEDTNGLEINDVEDDSMLVVTHDEKAEIWHIDMVVKEYGAGDVPVSKVKTGLQTISGHNKPITSAAFSPDAIALATASLDGYVKFFQVNIHDNEEPTKCLHEWRPHCGKPLSSLFFLDNHKICNSDSDLQFWKYAISGADNNQELRVWSCKTWTCLQTIRFLPSETDHRVPCLKAEIDLTANYLILSDINRNVLYIMKVSPEKNVSVTSIAEYVLKYPVLSFSILDIVLYRGKPSLKNSGDDDDDEDDEEEDDEDEKDDDSDSPERKSLSYLVKLFWIHSKSFQACRIVYYPKTDSTLHSTASISSSQDSFVYKDGLSDLSGDVTDQIGINDHVDMMKSTVPESGLSPSQCLPTPPGVLTSPSVSSTAAASLTPCLSSDYQECPEILLTPKDFTSLHSSLPPMSVTNSFKLSDSEEATDPQIIDNISDQDNIAALDGQPNSRTRRKSSQHSCSSSPSREVAEILSPSQILSHTNEVECSSMKENDISSIGANNTVICNSPTEQSEFAVEDWPLAPDPNKEYKVVPRTEGELRLQHASLEKNSLRHTGLADGDISSEELLASKSVLQRLERSVESLSATLGTVAEAVQTQNQILQYVQSDIQNLQQQQKYIQSNMQNLEAMDSAISTKIAHLISENSVSDFSRFENLFTQRDSEDVRRYEQQSAALAEQVVSAVSNRLDKVLKLEMKNTVTPHMSSYLDSIVHRLQEEFLQKLNSTDNALKECISKHLRSKAFGENLASSAAALLHSNIQMACKEAFQNSVIPSLDKCCQFLVSSMNDIFTKGSTDYVDKLNMHLQITAGNQEAMTKRCEDQISKLVADTQANFEHLSAKATQSALEATREREKVIAEIRQVVSEEVSKSVKESSAVVASAVLRSHQSTPAPQADPQISSQYVLQLAKQGQINEAFQQALSAMDIQIVLFLCESLSVEQVFDPVPCPLAQHVLLSLIQQLSADLNEKTEIRLRYIEDAITSLDINSPITKEHVGSVLGGLKRRVSMFLKQNPNHKSIRICKRINMTIESFLK